MSMHEKIQNINNSIGCIVRNGCVRIENTLFSVGKDAIYAWSTDTDELNECNAYSISDPIADLLDQSFFASCSVHLHYAMREIWFYNSNSNTVWIYNYKQKLWYSFGDFTPSAILDGGSQIRFFEGVLLCVFNPSLTSDVRNTVSTQVTATLKSGELEFNTKQKKKHPGTGASACKNIRFQRMSRLDKYLRTISATLKTMAWSNSRRSRPVIFLIFSRR